MKNYRHGDICLIGIKSIPKTAKLKKTTVILQSGSGGNPHKINTGKLYFVEGNEFIIGYLEAKDTSLIHNEHGEKKVGSEKYAKIDNGKYEIRRQVEYTVNGMKQVID